MALKTATTEIRTHQAMTKNESLLKAFLLVVPGGIKASFKVAVVSKSNEEISK